MTEDKEFYLAFLFLFGWLAVIRIYYHFKARTWDRARKPKRGKLFLVHFVLTTCTLVVLVLYGLDPTLLAWAAVTLPYELRWMGVLLGLAGVGLLWWTQRALGQYFSPVLSVRPNHALVVQGPYRWVRHPMYSAIGVFAVAISLLSANWLVGGLMLAGIAIVICLRTPVEEEMLLEALGEEYRQYMERTPRYVPLIRFSSQRGSRV